MLESKRLFEIPDSKPSTAQWFVDVDINSWLGSENISNVVFTATREDNNGNATSIVLDANKCTWNNDAGLLRPFIRGGNNGISYLVKMDVTTTDNAQDTFWVRFAVM